MLGSRQTATAISKHRCTLWFEKKYNVHIKLKFKMFATKQKNKRKSVFNALFTHVATEN